MRAWRTWSSCWTKPTRKKGRRRFSSPVSTALFYYPPDYGRLPPLLFSSARSRKCLLAGHCLSQKRRQVFGVLHWRAASEIRTNNGNGRLRLQGRKVGHSLCQGWRQVLRHGFAVGKVDHGFVHRERREGSLQQLLRSCVLTDHNDLGVRLGQPRRGNTVSSSVNSKLLRCACEDLERVLGLVPVLRVVGVGMKPQQRNGRTGIARGRGRILKRFAPRRQRAQLQLLFQ